MDNDRERNPEKYKKKNQPNRATRRKIQREQPKSDGKGGKRINFDNGRIDDPNVKAWFKAAAAKDANAISWYSANAELLKAATSISWTGVTGTPIVANASHSVPGIMRINWIPALNGASGAPINQAANSIYSFLVHANSRNYRYSPADLMMMIIAGACAFAGFARGVRAYGTMNRFNGLDYYTPQRLIQAQGFNYNDLRNNQSQMWFDLNHLANKLQQIWIPNVMPVLERWFWLNSKIYKDGDSAKSQYYIFAQRVDFVLSETGSTGGTSLVTQQATVPDTYTTWNTYIQNMNAMIDALLNSEDRGIIFGDILNAYGADKLYAVSTIPSDYMVDITYNMEVLTQIENLTVCETTTFGVTQNPNTGWITQNFQLDEVSAINGQSSGIRFAPASTILNFHQLTTPTPEQVMIATRLKCAGLKVNATDYSSSDKYIALEPAQCGTEIVTSVDAFEILWNTGLPNVTRIDTVTKASAAAGVSDAQDLYRWCAFDWAPWKYVVGTGVTIPTTTAPAVGTSFSLSAFTMALGDWDNWTTVDASVMEKMHTAAVYSEFGVPFSLS